MCAILPILQAKIIEGSFQHRYAKNRRVGDTTAQHKQREKRGVLCSVPIILLFLCFVILYSIYYGIYYIPGIYYI